MRQVRYNRREWCADWDPGLSVCSSDLERASRFSSCGWVRARQRHQACLSSHVAAPVISSCWRDLHCPLPRQAGETSSCLRLCSFSPCLPWENWPVSFLKVVLQQIYGVFFTIRWQIILEASITKSFLTLKKASRPWTKSYFPWKLMILRQFVHL